MWTEQTEARASKVKDLETWLGDHHNLAVLRARVEASGVEGLEVFLPLVGQEQRELERKSLALGIELYEQKPKHFIGELAQLWEAAAPKKSPASAAMKKAKTA